MDVICGRKTVGRTTGELLANGRPISKSSWSRVVRNRTEHCLTHRLCLSTLIGSTQPGQQYLQIHGLTNCPLAMQVCGEKVPMLLSCLVLTFRWAMWSRWTYTHPRRRCARHCGSAAGYGLAQRSQMSRCAYRKDCAKHKDKIAFIACTYHLLNHIFSDRSSALFLPTGPCVC